MPLEIYKYLLVIIGSIQAIMALLGFFFPHRIFLMWKKWVLNRFFPLHGIVLIFTGLPLTVYNGYLSGIIFIIGLVVVFSGPFILIYPEKLVKLFENSNELFSTKDIKVMIYVDAALRSGASMVFFISCWKTFLTK